MDTTVDTRNKRVHLRFQDSEGNPAPPPGDAYAYFTSSDVSVLRLAPDDSQWAYRILPVSPGKAQITVRVVDGLGNPYRNAEGVAFTVDPINIAVGPGSADTAQIEVTDEPPGPAPTPPPASIASSVDMSAPGAPHAVAIDAALQDHLASGGTLPGAPSADDATLPDAPPAPQPMQPTGSTTTPTGGAPGSAPTPSGEQTQPRGVDPAGTQEPGSSGAESGAGSSPAGAPSSSGGGEQSTAAPAGDGAGAPSALALTTTTLPDGTVGASYSATVTASGGTPPYRFSASGLPAGLSMDASGAITGSPSTPGSSSVALGVWDSTDASATGQAVINVAAPTA